MNNAKSIRWHLFQVLLVSIVPLGIFAAGLLYFHWQAQQRERERSQMESVRLLAAAVDNALDSTIQRLGIFARLWGTSASDERTVHAQARDALAASPDWINIVAFRADGGAGVFRADAPFGTVMPKMRLLEMWLPLVREQRPLVTDSFTSPSTGETLISVGVPVMRDWRVTHVLIANLNARWFDELLNKQGFPQGAVSGVIDRTFKFVARSAEGDARRGADAAGPLVADMKLRQEGLGRYTSLNGIGVYTSWTRTRHGWWAAFATPSAPVAAAFWNHLLILVGLWMAAVAAGLAFALAKSRRIAASLASIEGQAAELAQGRHIETPPVSDVQELARALDAIHQASEALQQAMRQRDASLDVERQARAAAEAANRAKDEFLAMLGHELRNPLAAISHAAAIIRGGCTPDQLEFASGVLTRQSQHLKRLIDDLLDVGRVMTGKIQLRRQPLDLASAVRQAVATIQAAGRLADRQLSIDVEPVWVDGDTARIEQIVVNLLENAATHTQPGGRIRVSTSNQGDEALLQVSDDGRGIEADALPKVFDLFFQGEATADRARGGLGIGLTLVQRLAELHGGSARAASGGPGRGATFTVRFPAATEARARVGLSLVGGASASRTLLLVEDNADARASLRMLLEMHGHQVLEAADGAGALEMLRRERPPIAVIDIGLPGMDGYEVARAARRELGRDIVLVALTGYGSAADGQRAIQAGFDRHVTKPVTLHDLMEAIGEARRAA